MLAPAVEACFQALPCETAPCTVPSPCPNGAADGAGGNGGNAHTKKKIIPWEDPCGVKSSTDSFFLIAPCGREPNMFQIEWCHRGTPLSLSLDLLGGVSCAVLGDLGGTPGSVA